MVVSQVSDKTIRGHCSAQDVSKPDIPTSCLLTSCLSLVVLLSIALEQGDNNENKAHNMTCVEIPGTLLQSFFERATTALNALDLSSHDSSGTGTEGPDTTGDTNTKRENETRDCESSARSLSQHRLSILQVQQSCLSQVLADYNQAHASSLSSS